MSIASLKGLVPISIPTSVTETDECCVSWTLRRTCRPVCRQEMICALVEVDLEVPPVDQENHGTS